MTFDIKEFLTENKTSLNERSYGDVGGYADTAFEQLRDVENLLNQGKEAAKGNIDGERSRLVVRYFETSLGYVKTAQRMMKIVVTQHKQR